MTDKFYQFHYAEKAGPETISLGILNYSTSKSITKQDLSTVVKTYLKKPDAEIVITHITKLKKSEYEKMTGVKLK